MSVGEAVAWAEEKLKEAGVDTPRLDAQMLVAHCLDAERSYVIAHVNDPFEHFFSLEPLIGRRVEREPLAYILGWREFYGRRFLVNSDVLIPRQETEVLVEVALSIRHVEDVLDLGTGSGCIAITLALEMPEWTVAAVDMSEYALEVARENARRLLGDSRKVHFVNSDYFEELHGEQFDLIVSNPPYVAELESLQPEVGKHEPPLALLAAEGGLGEYRRIAEEAPPFLRLGGTLIVEVGDRTADQVAELFEEYGWHVEKTIDDLNGTPRVLVLKLIEA